MGGGGASAGAASGEGGTASTDSGGTPGGGAGGSSGEQGIGGHGTCETSEGCPVDWVYGLIAEIPLSWSANEVVSDGSGTARLGFRLDLEDEDGAVAGYAEVCDIELPWYEKEDGVGYELDFEVYELPKQVPAFRVTGSRSCGSFELNAFAFVVGAELADPLDAPWPDRADLMPRDDDGDGRPAYTVMGMYDTGAMPFPVEANNTTFTQEAFMALRFATSGKFQLPNCAGSTTTGETLHFDLTAMGCNVCESTTPEEWDFCADTGEECTEDQTAFLDGWMGNYVVGPTRLRLVRLDRGTSCADVRNIR